MLGQRPAEAEHISWKAFPLVHATLHISCHIFSLLEKDGRDMQIANKADPVCLGDLSDAIQGHALINGDALRPAACHLTDDPTALSSRPETRGPARAMNDFPCRLKIGNDVLLEIVRPEHGSGRVVDRHDITADHLGIDAR